MRGSEKPPGDPAEERLDDPAYFAAWEPPSARLAVSST